MERRFASNFLALCLVVLAGCGNSAARPLGEQVEQVFVEAGAKGFNGSVLVTRNGAVLYQGTFGLADEQQRVANTSATRFLGFSVNKPMTAVLVFQQIGAGKLQLEDRLDAFHAGLKGRAAGAITLGQLLSHTSGIEEVISAHQDRRISFEDLANAKVPDAGEFHYSSTGFVILALVLEVATGHSYGDLIQERIFDPAGMKDSGLLRTGLSVEGLAMGHRTRDGRRGPAPLGVAPEALEGAGTLFTTTGDLARFDQALSAGQLLSADQQKQMYTRMSDDRAYGWSLGEQGGQYFPWHKGSFHGFTAVLVRQVHRHEMIAILSNDEDADVLGLRTQVLRLLKRNP